MKALIIILLFSVSAHAEPIRKIGGNISRVAADGRYVNLTEASTVTLAGNAFSVGGTTLTVASGLVGIGAAPSAGTLLTVYDGATLNGLKVQSGGVNGTYYPIVATNAGGTKGVWVRDNGHMGINVSAPASELDIKSDMAPSAYVVKVSSQDSTIMFGIGGNGVVGIGTGAPLNKLHISSGTIRMEGTGTPAKGAALCLTAAGVLGTCTGGTLDACTCTAP